MRHLSWRERAERYVSATALPLSAGTLSLYAIPKEKYLLVQHASINASGIAAAGAGVVSAQIATAHGTWGDANAGAFVLCGVQLGFAALATAQGYQWGSDSIVEPILLYGGPGGMQVNTIVAATAVLEGGTATLRGLLLGEVEIEHERDRLDELLEYLKLTRGG